MTTFGFFSAVQKPGDKFLTVRARLSADLDELAKRCPSLGKKCESPNGDYRWRATVAHAEFAAVISAEILGIKYSNHKQETQRVSGRNLHDVYSRVWAVMHDAQEQEIREQRPVKNRSRAHGQYRLSFNESPSRDSKGRQYRCPNCGSVLQSMAGRLYCSDTSCISYGLEPA